MRPSTARRDTSPEGSCRRSKHFTPIPRPLKQREMHSSPENTSTKQSLKRSVPFCGWTLRRALPACGGAVSVNLCRLCLHSAAAALSLPENLLGHGPLLVSLDIAIAGPPAAPAYLLQNIFGPPGGPARPRCGGPCTRQAATSPDPAPGPLSLTRL